MFEKRPASHAGISKGHGRTLGGSDKLLDERTKCLPERLTRVNPWYDFHGLTAAAVGCFIYLYS